MGRNRPVSRSERLDPVRRYQLVNPARGITHAATETGIEDPYGLDLI